MGDSITASFDTQSLLPEYDIINKALPANNSSHLLKRLKRDLLASNPDIIFILIGTNDIAKGIADAEIIANIKSIVEISSENIPLNSIFITSILPTRNNELRPNERIMGLNKKIKLTAKNLKVNYLNLYSNFVDETGQLIIDLTNDGLHLNEKAYLKWAGFLKEFLKEKLS
jgi:lysophospholipase L1-like esterase